MEREECKSDEGRRGREIDASAGRRSFIVVSGCVFASGLFNATIDDFLPFGMRTVWIVHRSEHTTSWGTPARAREVVTSGGKNNSKWRIICM